MDELLGHHPHERTTPAAGSAPGSASGPATPDETGQTTSTAAPWDTFRWGLRLQPTSAPEETKDETSTEADADVDSPDSADGSPSNSVGEPFEVYSDESGLTDHMEVATVSFEQCVAAGPQGTAEQPRDVFVVVQTRGVGKTARAFHVARTQYVFFLDTGMRNPDLEAFMRKLRTVADNDHVSPLDVSEEWWKTLIDRCWLLLRAWLQSPDSDSPVSPRYGKLDSLAFFRYFLEDGLRFINDTIEKPVGIVPIVHSLPSPVLFCFDEVGRMLFSALKPILRGKSARLRGLFAGLSYTLGRISICRHCVYGTCCAPRCNCRQIVPQL